MSASPIPARRRNVLNGRSRSPSPTAISTGVHDNNIHNNNQPHTSLAEARNNFFNPENSNLYRIRRSTPNFAVKDEEEAHPSETIPLIDDENFLPPIASPEIDDLGDDRETVDAPYPGVDDGFFWNRSNADGPTPIPRSPDGSVDDVDGVVRRKAPRGFDIPISPTDTKFPRFPDVELGTIPDLENMPDLNVYQHKKTLAQGMMDLALFSANANQLRYVLESNQHPYYYPGVILITISLVLQVAIGVGLIWNARYNVKDDKEIRAANRINNFTVIGIFLVTVVNVFVSAFGVASQPVPAVSANT